jgi:hypothetical protein
MEEMRRRLNAAEREAEEMSARLSSEELSYEAKLTEVYNAHRERVEKLSWDIGSRDEELQQVGRGDGEARGPGVTSPADDSCLRHFRRARRWSNGRRSGKRSYRRRIRSTQRCFASRQPPSTTAEHCPALTTPRCPLQLLTLRSEFEKSSATYEREIEGLKEMLEKARANKDQLAAALEGEESELAAAAKVLDESRSELARLDVAGEEEGRALVRGEQQLDEARAAAERAKEVWEAAVKGSTSLEVELQTLRAAKGRSGDAGGEAARLRAELDAAQTAGAAHAGAAEKLEAVRARKREVEATLDPLQQRLASEAESARTEAALARESLSEARSAVAKWEQECALQGTSKDNLLDEVNALKAEAKDLTEAHAREVERLQERLGQLEGVHDTLDVALAEGEQKFEAELAGKRDEFEAKVRQQEEQAASLTQQHEEVRGGLVEVRQALSLEQKERQVAEEAMRDARETAEQKVADAEERERRLQESLDDIQSERKRIEGESADERRDAEEKLKKLTDDHGEVTRKQKEAQERAAEFERQWIAESKLRKELHNTLQEIVGNLRVYCRIRPPVMGEESHVFANGQTGLLCTDVRGQDVVVVRDHDAERPVEKKFEFTQVYGPASSQEDVFRDTEPLMTSVLDGFNVCIFAYGQSGSGKTFTMEGTEEKQGLVPRAMARVFEAIGERTANYTHECFLSMIEIYNEQVRDLLVEKDVDTSRKKYEIMRDALVGMYVKDLTSEPVHTASHTKTLIKRGNLTRSVGATNLNEQSSRSHMLVTLTVRTTDLHTNDHYVGKLSLVDLAGSERLAKSQTSGAALKETQAINKSLSALGTVIAALANQEKHVPYRDSKLTYLLQDSLGGNSKTLMFANCGPSQLNYAETVNSLNFASRAKSVALGKATKNREALQPSATGKAAARTTMAAARALGDEAEAAQAKSKAIGARR